MPEKRKPNLPAPTHKNNHGVVPSDYVRLEADLVSLSDSQEQQNRPKTILVFCSSYDLVREVSSELKSKIGADAEILITTEADVASRLIDNGNIDLLLRGPGTPDLNSEAEERGVQKPLAGATLVVLRPASTTIQRWMKQDESARHLIHAVSSLNK